jgi:hypothetical protein
MKMFSKRQAFTVVEMMTAVAVLAVAGQMIFLVLRNGMILHAKNSAVNAAHHEARIAAARLVRDVHGAVSIPQLFEMCDSNGVTVTGPNFAGFKKVTTQPLDASGKPAGVPGVSFQNVVWGPINLKNDPSSEIIQFYRGTFEPEIGHRLIMPLYGVEEDIVDKHENPASNHFQLWLKNSAHKRIKEKQGSYITAYITTRTAYVVVGGELRWYPKVDFHPNPPGEFHVAARFVTSAKPFFVPLNASGTTDTRYVGVKLVTSDPKFSNRDFKAENTLLETSIPYRAQLAKYQ